MGQNGTQLAEAAAPVRAMQMAQEYDSTQAVFSIHLLIFCATHQCISEKSSSAD